MGIPLEITERAGQVTDLVSRFEIVELLDVEMTAEEAEELSEAEAVARRFLAWNLDGAGRDGAEEGAVARALGEIVGVYS
jgi:DNA mismatch repair protein MSH5